MDNKICSNFASGSKFQKNFHECQLQKYAILTGNFGSYLLIPRYGKDGGCTFPSNALQSKLFTKANGCLLKDKRKAGGGFVYSAKISQH